MNDEGHAIVIVGNKGMLGRCFAPLLEARAVPCHGYDLPELDMTDRDQVLALCDELRPAAVINCAAYTDVDGAETQTERAMRLNRDGPAILAEGCLTVGATLVHYSTDYVFSGQASQPYSVDAPIDPVNAYGVTKAAGEKAICDSGCNHLIIRSSWLYAAHGANFVLTIAKLARERSELKVVDDQRGRPTSCKVLAETTLKLLEAGVRGTFHLTDGGEASWHDFAKAIAAAANPECVVHPCSSDEFPRPAKRPAYSVLDLGPAEQVIGPLTAWETNLAEVLNEIGS